MNQVEYRFFRICRMITFSILMTILLPSYIYGQDSILLKKLVTSINLLENGNFEHSVKSFNNIIHEAEKKQDYTIMVLANINKGALFYRFAEYEKALNYYFLALDIAQQNHINHLLNTIYNNIGIIYSTNNNPEKAKEYYQAALKISKQSNDSIKIGINYLNLANHENDLKNYTLAISYCDSAEVFINPKQHTKNLSALYNIKGIIYKNQQKYYLARASQLLALKTIEPVYDKYYIAEYSYQLGENYRHLNMLDSALIYLNKSFTFSKEINNKELIVNNLQSVAKIQAQQGLNQQAYSSYQQCINWKDSLLTERSNKWVSELQMKYEFNKKQQEINSLKYQNKLSLIILLLSITLLGAGGFILYIVLKNKNNKTRQQNTLLRQEKILKELEIQKSEAENKYLLEEIKTREAKSFAKQEKLELKLDHQKRELVSNALHIVNKNNILSEILNQLNKLDTAHPQQIKKDIHSITKTINVNINLDNDWDTFKMHFEKVNGSFFNNLKNDFPDLSQGDLKLCAYLILNLNPKEIAQILNISPDSIRKRKQRLKGKLNLNKENDLLVFLNHYKY